MSRNGDVSLAWGDGEYSFRLAYGELEKLQEACDAGPFHVLQALRSGTPRIEHILETIRWGLIGGGLSSSEALRMTNLYVKERPLAENVVTATIILVAALYGGGDETDEASPPEKKLEAGEG
ncbi:MAG: gene transfer agent family protein [Pseudomonadota bacterium]